MTSRYRNYAIQKLCYVSFWRVRCLWTGHTTFVSLTDCTMIGSGWWRRLYKIDIGRAGPLICVVLATGDSYQQYQPEAVFYMCTPTSFIVLLRLLLWRQFFTFTYTFWSPLPQAPKCSIHFQNIYSKFYKINTFNHFWIILFFINRNIQYNLEKKRLLNEQVENRN